MKKKYVAAAVLLIILLISAMAVLRGLASREVVLKENGQPSANLKGDFLAEASTTIIETNTDANGKLDLRNLPSGTQRIRLNLRNDTGYARNELITLPAFGTLTIDRCGNQTICTTKKTYADFLLLQYSVTKSQVIECRTTDASHKTEAK